MEALMHIVGNLENGQGNMVRTGNKLTPLLQRPNLADQMQLLANAITSARQGRPQEIDVQYYELTSATMLSRLVRGPPERAARFASTSDPGRPFIATNGSFEVSEIPRKLLSLQRLMDGARDADIAVTLYPAEGLGRGNLMHRKLFRVGDKVILGGMNANSASSEEHRRRRSG